MLQNVKEKLEVEMKEMAKALRQEADEKAQQQDIKANTEIESLNKELHMWKVGVGYIMQSYFVAFLVTLSILSL